MTRRVFLHVGLPKTGTTYLQDGIWKHKAALGDRGLLVPGRFRRRHLLASLDLREAPSLSDRPGDVAQPWTDLVEEILAWDGDALVSHEFFASARPRNIERAVADLGDRELHVIVTARPSSTVGVSRWQEWVKNGGTRPLEEFPPRLRGISEWKWASFDLATVLRTWGKVVPPERVHVLPLAPRGTSPDELWHRFLGVVGVDGTDLPVAQKPRNISLGVAEVELLRRVNPYLEEFHGPMDRGLWIRGYLGEGDVLPRTGEPIGAPPELAAELRRRGEEARDLLQNHGYDLVGELDWLESPDHPEWRLPSDVSDGEMLALATRTIANMLSDYRALTREKRELDALLEEMRTPLWRRALRGVARRIRREKGEKS